MLQFTCVTSQQDTQQSCVCTTEKNHCIVELIKHYT